MPSPPLPAIGKITTHTDGPTGWITFDNPARRNAVSLAMWQQLADAVTGFADDASVRVIVLRGAGGKAFVSGADISEFGEQRASHEQVARYNRTSEAARQALSAVNKPTIAMIEGFCIGGGLGVALACDLRFASAGSQFAVPAARLGLGYDAQGVRKMIDVVGPAFTKEIFFSARRFSDQEALAMGLINRVYAVDGLEEAVRSSAAAMAANAPLTLAAVKTVVGELLKNESSRDDHLCAQVVARCFASADYVEGRQAFMERREPRFTGS